MSATTIISVIAGPLCGATLKYFDGIYGLAGWQWLFIVQGVPAAVLGVVIFFYLQDRPADANWLTSAEKNILSHNLEHDKKAIVGESAGTLGQMFRDPKVYVLALVYFLLLGATYTLVFWFADPDPELGVKDLLLIGIYAAIPNAVGVIGMILIGRNSDKLRERRWHFRRLCWPLQPSASGINHAAARTAGGIAIGAIVGDDRNRGRDAALLYPYYRVSFQSGGRGRHRAHQQSGQPRPGRESVA